jgi:hypothetical protein
MNWLLSADLHLSDRARDGYRFGLFSWLAKQQQKHKVDATFLLGDLTQEKDRHSSALVNRIVEELLKLAPPVYILRGNHDGTNPNSPYFKFLSSISGLTFVVNPTFLHRYEIAMIPHCAGQATLDAACKRMPINPKAAFCHQTFSGAIAETGAVLSGLSASPVSALKPWLGVYSGDIHVPQRCDAVTYVGAPYHIRFNDQFEPRCLLLKGGGKSDLHFDCPRKFSLTVHDADDIANNKALRSGDQVKITVELAREEAVEWHEHKRRVLAACREGGLDVFGINCTVKTARRKRVKLIEGPKTNTPQDILEFFCANEGVASNLKQAGLELLNDRPSNA